MPSFPRQTIDVGHFEGGYYDLDPAEALTISKTLGGAPQIIRAVLVGVTADINPGSARLVHLNFTDDSGGAVNTFPVYAPAEQAAWMFWMLPPNVGITSQRVRSLQILPPASGATLGVRCRVFAAAAYAEVP